MNQREELSRDLSAYLDGELPAPRAKQIEQVLAYDHDLADELRRLKATRSLLREMPLAQPPADFARHVLARTERARLLGRGPAQSYASFRWVSLATAAVVLIAAGLGWLLIVNNTAPVSAPQVQSRGELARAPESPDDKNIVEIPAPVAEPADAPSEMVAAKSAEGSGGVGDADAEKPGGRMAPGGPAKEFKTEDGFTALDEELQKIARDAGSSARKADRPAGVSVAAKGQENRAGAEAATPIAPEAAQRNVPEKSAAARGETAKSKRPPDLPQPPCVVIYTANMSFAQRDVENALIRNGVSRLKTERMKSVANKGSQAPNYFRASEVTVSQVTYEAYVDPSQLQDVRKALEEVRGQQTVSQVPATDLDAGQAAAATTETDGKRESLTFKRQPANAAEEAEEPALHRRAPSSGPDSSATAQVHNPLADTIAVMPEPPAQAQARPNVQRMIITLNLRPAPGEEKFQAARRQAATQAASQPTPETLMETPASAPSAPGP